MIYSIDDVKKMLDEILAKFVEDREARTLAIAPKLRKIIEDLKDRV